MQLNYERFMAEAARAVDLPLQPAAVPEIAATLKMLESMAQEVMTFALDSHVEPAAVFIP